MSNYDWLKKVHVQSSSLRHEGDSSDANVLPFQAYEKTYCDSLIMSQKTAKSLVSYIPLLGQQQGFGCDGIQTNDSHNSPGSIILNHTTRPLPHLNKINESTLHPLNGKIPGPSCSKLTTSLVSVSLKFQTLILQIHCYFLLKKCENPLHCKGFSDFFNKK